MRDHKTFLLLAAGALFSLCAVAPAEVVRLTDGRLLQGEILEHDETGIVFQRWDNGGKAKLPWSLMIPRDETSLKKELGYIIETEDQELDIDALQITLTNGSTMTGLEVEAESTETELALRSIGTTLRLPRSSIESIDPIRLPILQVLAEDEIYDELVRRFEPADAESHYRLGDALMRSYVYDRALEHLTTARDTGGVTYEELTRQPIAACELALENAELQAKLREIEGLIGQNYYLRAEELVEALAIEYEGTGRFDMGSPDARGPGLKLLARIADEQDQWLTKEVGRRFYREMKDVASDFVAGRLESWTDELEVTQEGAKPTFSDAQGFGRGKMMEEILVRLEARFSVPVAKTTLGSDLRLDDTEILLSNTRDFPEPGDKRFPEEAVFMVKIGDEVIEYTGINGKRLTGCKRGVEGTSPQSHSRADAAEFMLDSNAAGKLQVDVRSYFEKRPSNTQRASYHSGTYIVDMRGREIVKQGSQARGGNNSRRGGTSAEDLRRRMRGGGGGGGGGSQQKDPEEWWEAADSSVRRSWLTAFFAESNLTVTGIDYRTCSSCGGRGALTVYASTGGSSSKICPRCSGPGADRVVQFY